MGDDLTLTEVSYHYPRTARPALDHITTTIRGSGFTAVMGASGAGKSTLLKALCGIVPKLTGGTLRGRIRYGDADLADHKVATITEYIGLVLQDAAAQQVATTVAADVGFGPRNRLLPGPEIGARVGEALARVGLAGFESRRVAELSGGEQQRLAIAGVLATKPDLLCLDEATAELDPDGVDQVRGVVDDLRDQGLGAVSAEQQADAVLGRADRLLVLDRGSPVWQGDPRDFFTRPGLAQRLGVRPPAMAVLAEKLIAAREDVPLPASGLPLSVPEAAEWLAPLLPGGAPSFHSQQLVSTRSAISVRGLRFGYPGGPEVLRGVDLDVGRGELVALVGPNGAGKTTLVKQLTGLLRPNSGRVLIDGRDISGVPVWQLAERVGFCFQNPDHQLFRTTVFDEVAEALRVAGTPPAQVPRRVHDILVTTGLEGFAEAHPLTLGRADRKLVALASVLVTRPEVLIVDEPTSGQDWRGIQQVMGVLDALNQSGTTILMISHDADLVAAHATRAVRLSAGQVVADGPPAEVVDSATTRLWRQLFGAQPPPTGDPRVVAGVLARHLAGGR